MNKHATRKPKKVRPTNRRFSDVYSYAGTYDTPTAIKLTRYNATDIETIDVPLDTKSFKSLTNKQNINWFEVNGMTDAATITRLVKEFGLTSMDLRDILTPVHVVKVDKYDDSILFVLNSCTFDGEEDIKSEHICIFANQNTVISFTEQECECSIFKNVESALSSNTMNIRSGKAGTLLGFLINSFLSVQVDTAAKLEDLLEGIEHFLLGGGHSHTHISSKIQKSRHAHLVLQKNILPLKRQFKKMLKEKNVLITNEVYPMFDELNDELAYAIQTTNNCKEILESLVDLYISQSDYRTNAIMKHLTVMATFFIPVTFLVGVWGMNFKYMPEIDWKYGYAFAWGSMALCIAVTWYIMKRKHWF